MIMLYKYEIYQFFMIFVYLIYVLGIYYYLRFLKNLELLHLVDLVLQWVSSFSLSIHLFMALLVQLHNSMILLILQSHQNVFHGFICILICGEVLIEDFMTF